MFYSVISSTQGGWTALSSEGRYMGAAAFGDMNRSTNRFYSHLRNMFSLQPNGEVHLNRSLASWPQHMLRKPYTPELISILGPPIAPEDMWNPMLSFVLRTFITIPIRKSGSIRRRPPKWCLKMPLFTLLIVYPKHW